MEYKKAWMVWLSTALLMGSFFFSYAGADGLSADDIVKKSFAVDGGDDSLSRISFIFQEDGQPERRLTYFMAWKKFKGAGDIDSKVIMFREFPPDAKGVSYMGFFYRPELNRNDDEWLYLPELRLVRKLSHSGPKHAKEEEFTKSELRQYDLVPRDPGADGHQLLRSEALEGVDCYVIESTTKGRADYYPYSKAIKWIAKDGFLPLRIDYYDEKGKLLKQQTFKWKQAGDAWVWEEVTAENVQTANKTTLRISDIRVNVGLTDDAFTKRVMQVGMEGVK